MPKPPRTLIVSCMKNEGPFILEWVAHHMSVGVTDFLIYTNDCDDGTNAIWERLQAMGLGQHRVNKILNRGVQKSALYHARNEDVVRDADWHLVLDVDEFINIKTGDGTLAALRDACPHANTFAMTWRCFGDGGNIAYRDDLMIGQFMLAAPELMPTPAQAWGVKTLYRNDGLFGKMGVHIPQDPSEARIGEIVTVNGSGQILPDSHKTGKWRSDRSSYGYDLVQLNHYAVRSVESFLIKRDRGRVNHMDHDQGLAYWQMMSHNHAPENSVQRHLARTRTAFEALLRDAELARLHTQAVTWHRTRIAALKKNADFARLFDAIVDEIATRPAPVDLAA